MFAKKNLIGQKFGRLTVMEDSRKRVEKSRIVWICICDCGNPKEVDTKRLTTGRTKSCGCLRKELMSERMKIHGDSKSRIYRIWYNMKRRCYDKKHDDYKSYGTKGIEVSPEWRNNYLAFKMWALSHGYQNNLTIDRVNNQRNYEPENCQWLSVSRHAKKSYKERDYYGKFHMLQSKG